MKYRELVSIIIPAYNSEQTIANTLLSCINQTYDLIEILVIDDGSTDGTKEIVEGIINNNLNFNLRYIYQLNSGVSVARNNGIKNAKGDYVAFLDSDDCFHPRFVEINLINMVEYGSKLSISRYSNFSNVLDKIINTDIEISHFEINQIIEFLAYRKVNFGMWSCLYNLKLIKENELFFNKSYKYGEDLVFLWKYVTYITSSVFINLELHFYNVHENSVTSIISYNKIDLFNIFLDLNKEITNIKIKTMFESYLLPRIVWTVCKSFSLMKRRDYLFKFLNEDFVRYYLKKINFKHGFFILITGKILLLNKHLYYFLIQFLLRGRK